MDQAGLVVVAMAGLWIAYLVPHRLRFRQQLLEARADDRFSEHLRVIRVARPPAAVRSSRYHAAPAGRVLLHPPGPGARAPHARGRRGDGPMDRPHAAGDRVVADEVRRTAAARAARAAALARRRAAARRRASLVAVLLVASVAGWSAGPLAGATVLAGAVPTALLVTTLLLGRAAVLAGRRSDARWALDPASRAGQPTTPGIVGRAVRPDDASTEVMARVPAVRRRSVTAPVASERAAAAERLSTAAADVAQAAPLAERPEREASQHGADAVSGASWVPVPVPRPSYTLKPEARRDEPAPLPLDEPAAPVAAAPAGVRDEGVRPTTGGLALDAILARRRASGE